MKKKQFVLSAILLVVFSLGYTTDNNDISKIYLYEDYLLKCDLLEGITIYDIENPISPEELGQIQFEGNADIAIRNDYLFADQHHDLVIYDIQDITSPVAVDTIKNVFSTAFVPELVFTGIDQTRSNGWGCSESHPVASPTLMTEGTHNTGQGGSLARFMIVDDCLYCIDDNVLHIFDITDPSRPQKKNDLYVAWNIETLFSYEHYLFIGGMQGVYIYDISSPEYPEEMSRFIHTTSCDPVVVEDDIAYVTLRSGTMCGQDKNMLQLLDVSDITKPELITTYALVNPYGLAVNNKNVYLCDGNAGLKVVKTDDHSNISTVTNIKKFKPYDVILRSPFLFVTASEGIYIYRVENEINLTFVSAITN